MDQWLASRPGQGARTETLTTQTVEAITTAATRDQERGLAPMLAVYRQDADMPAGTGATLGAGWWRAVAGMARHTCPGLVIGYVDELDHLTGSREATLTRATTPTRVSTLVSGSAGR